MMNKRSQFALAILFLYFFSHQLLAQTTMFGGRGLLRTQSAELIGINKFYVNSYFSAFMLLEKDATSMTKNYGIVTNFTLGLNRHVELIAHFKPYQDDQNNIWGAPGDSRLGLKIRTPFSNAMIHTALQLYVNLPTGRDLNIKYEPYSSREAGVAGMALLTVDFMEIFSSFPLKWHLNLGYFDQNIHDRFFLNIEDQYLLATGLKFPVNSAIFYSEYSAEIFANNAFITAYNMNSQRLTQGLKFLGPWDLIYDFAFDISLSANAEVCDAGNEFRKQYADWKFIFGLNYPFSIQKKKNRTRKRGKIPVKPAAASGAKSSSRDNYLDSMLEIEKVLKKESAGQPQNAGAPNDNK